MVSKINKAINIQEHEEKKVVWHGHRPTPKQSTFH